MNKNKQTRRNKHTVKNLIICLLYLFADITLISLIGIFIYFENVEVTIPYTSKNDLSESDTDNEVISNNNNIETDNSIEDIIDENNLNNTFEETNQSIVYNAYIEAININESELIKGQLSTTYHDIKINSDELQFLEPGAIYRSLARKIEGFYMETTKNSYTSNYDNYIPLICGIESQPTYDEMKIYVDKAHLVVTEENALQSIMSAFQQTECISGNFDYDNNIFDFEIHDLKTASVQLGISEKMLGYTLAMLEEYAPSVEFSENSYKCTWIRI